MGKQEPSLASKLPETSMRDVKQKIINQIQKQGELFQSAIPMLQQLEKVKGDMNPPAIQSVGMGNFTSALSQLQSLMSMFSNRSNKSSTQKKKEDEDQEVKTEVDCSLENRGNLSDTDRAWCEYLDEINNHEDEEVA